MLRFLRRHGSTVVVAMVTAAMTAAVPAIASTVVNADKLDGRKGVGCSATLANRKNVYVATCGTGASAGFLPNDIIRKAPDADKLDGKDSLVFLTRVQHVSEDPTDIVLTGSDKAVIGVEINPRKPSTIMVSASVDLFTRSDTAGSASCHLVIQEGHQVFTEDTFTDFPAVGNYDIQVPLTGAVHVSPGFYDVAAECNTNGDVAYDRGDFVAWTASDRNAH